MRSRMQIAAGKARIGIFLYSFQLRLLPGIVTLFIYAIQTLYAIYQLAYEYTSTCQMKSSCRVFFSANESECLRYEKFFSDGSDHAWVPGDNTHSAPNFFSTDMVRCLYFQHRYYTLKSQLECRYFSWLSPADSQHIPSLTFVTPIFLTIIKSRDVY